MNQSGPRPMSDLSTIPGPPSYESMQLPLSPPNPKHQIRSPPKKLSLGSIPSDKSVDPPPTESSNAASLGRGSEPKDPSMTELHPSMGQHLKGKSASLVVLQ